MNFANKIALLMLVAAASTFAQLQDQNRNRDQSQPVPLDELTGSKQMQTSTSGYTAVQPNGLPLEATIDPARYIVGPSDGIAVNIWLSPPFSFVLTVTPEGTLIIPTVGEVRVSDLTLAAAKEKVIATVREKYARGKVSVTLVRPRPIIVTVIGRVLNPGLYTVTSIDRANRAIEEANTATQTQRDFRLAPILDGMSRRNIVLRHKDGTQQKVDIVKFLATKDERWNPTLREGDVVIVPRKDVLRNVIGIYGEVNTPGRYEFVQGDSLLDLLAIGQGFTPFARKDSVLLTRLNYDGTTMSTSAVDLGAIQGAITPNIALEPGDRVVVLSRPDLREDYRVEIEGEVRYPGTYPITRNTTKLSDLIRRAGGITEFASLPMAQVFRKSVPVDEWETERTLFLKSNIDPDDTADARRQNDALLRRQYVNVDFTKLISEHDSTQDVILEPEDSVAIPSQRNAVYVFGQVVSPGYITYETGESLDYYVDQAGGYTDKAQTGETRVVKRRTFQWLEADATSIEPGDMIWVPHTPERNLLYYMSILGYAASILSVAVGIAVVAIQLKK